MLAELEALLFVAGDEGLTLDQLALLLEKDQPAVRDQVQRLKEALLANQETGLCLLETRGRYQLVTKSQFQALLERYASSPFSLTLSKAALETLAIIAYEQPVTRVEVDQIRGVNSSNMIQQLILRGLVEEAGRLDGPGRPKIYQTTAYFMDYFGLSCIEDMPDFQLIKDAIDEEQETPELFNGN